METVELPDYRAERPSSRLKKIEFLKQHHAITGNIEDPTPGAPAACVRNQRAEERFQEMELDGIASWSNGDGIAEIAVPFSGVKSGNLRRRSGILPDGGTAPDEVIVPTPVCAVGIGKTRLMRRNSDRLQLSRRTRGKFQRAHECRLSPT